MKWVPETTEAVLRVATPARLAFKPGEAVGLSIDPEACRLIPA